VTLHAERIARLQAALASLEASGAGAIGLTKRTSNLFRDRAPKARPRIDLTGFDEVIRIDAATGIVESEGMVPYVALADATLAHGMMPAVVPQLRSITLGGAVAGVGIESSSFRRGLVHETVVALEVLTGDGRVLVCTPDNEHRDLFYGFPNSYGTLGYALAVTARLLPVQPYVVLEHIRYTQPEACFAAIAAHCAEQSLDFLDGVVFAPNELVLTLGRFTTEVPRKSDYTFDKIYYRAVREGGADWLTVRDYLWRWDTDWFWCSKNVGAQIPWLRRLYGRKRLNSVTYQKIMRFNSRWGITRAISRLRRRHPESVIQDVDIPLAHAAEFLAFLHREIGILPIWLCPIRSPDPGKRYPLYPLAPGTVYVNFGFWDVVEDRVPRPPGHRNRMIERKVTELGGLKSLYSDSYYPEGEFWAAYDRAAYIALKAKYDPAGALPDLYAKCVRGILVTAPRAADRR
jgi:FAD/FMN-containing dehydrogenase